MKVRGKRLAGLILAACVAAAACLVAILPDQGEVRRLHEERTQLLDRHREAARLAINLPVYREQVKALDAGFGILLGALPNARYPWSQQDRKAVEDAVLAAAAAAGVGKPSLSFAPTEYNESFTWEEVEVSASGEYARIADFLQRISTASGGDWIVRHAAVAPGGDRRGVRLVARIRAFGLMDPEIYATLQKARR